LTQAGELIGNGRGCWGGRTAEGTPVVTTWEHHPGAGAGRRFIWKPVTNHGGLRDLWDTGRIMPGARVRVIELRHRGPVPDDDTQRVVGQARLLPGCWRVVSPPYVNPGETTARAIIEPEVGNASQGERDRIPGRREDELRAAGLSPVQFWAPDIRAPGFAEKIRQQCQAIAAAENTPVGRAEVEFWEAATTDAWDGLE
jgi:hypothetical protein